MARTRTDIHRPSAEEFDPEGYDCFGCFDLNAGAEGNIIEAEGLTVVGEGPAAYYVPKNWEDCTPAEITARRDRNWSIAAEIAARVKTYAQPLSEKQAAFMLTLHTRYQERQAKLAEEARKIETGEIAAAPVGRVVITGEVLSTKAVDSDFGTTLKMLVRDDRGFKVWGSIPSGLQYPAVESRIDKGDRVTFTATVEQKEGEPTFGFSRPSEASKLEGEKVTA